MALGALFGLANLVLLALLVRAVLRAGGAHRSRAALVAIAKFPVLYALGYLALRATHVEPVAFLAGFTTVLAALLVTALVTAAFDTTTKGRPALDGPAGVSTANKEGHDTPA